MKKLSLYIFLVLMLCNVAQALPECEGSDISKWTNCKGTYTYSDGNKYSGDFGDEPTIRHGTGTMTSADGRYKYFGEIKNNKSEGLGVYTLPDGSIYVGEVKEGNRYGYGTMFMQDGTKVMGQFENLPNGYANIINSDGSIIKGIFKNFELIEKSENIEPQCKGTYVSPKESNDWTNCRGQAKITAAGLIYDADFVNGIPTGIGSVEILEGGKFSEATKMAPGIYVGQLKIISNWGEKDGSGVNLWNNGDTYVGEWKNGSSHGKGIMRYGNGDVYLGEKKNGERHGQGSYTYTDGTGYVGEWKDGKENGFGTETFPDGKKYVGEFKDGYQHGKGICTSPSGLKLDCKMEKGVWVQ